MDLLFSIPVLVNALEICNPESQLARRLFQVSIQAYVVKLVYWILERPCFGLTEEQNGFIQTLTQKICLAESQPTFARWRAITYPLLQGLAVEDRKQEMAILAEKAMQNLIALGTCLTGCQLSEEDRANQQQDVDAFMKDIIQHSMQLTNMVSINIMSANYSSYAPIGETFDPQAMEMPHSTTEAIDKDNVVAVTRLGVLRSEKLGREAVEGVTHVRTIQLKAHVLTEQEVSGMLLHASQSELATGKSPGGIASYDMRPPSGKSTNNKLTNSPSTSKPRQALTKSNSQRQNKSRSGPQNKSKRESSDLNQESQPSPDVVKASSPKDSSVLLPRSPSQAPKRESLHKRNVTDDLDRHRDSRPHRGSSSALNMRGHTRGGYIKSKSRGRAVQNSSDSRPSVDQHLNDQPSQDRGITNSEISSGANLQSPEHFSQPSNATSEVYETGLEAPIVPQSEKEKQLSRHTTARVSLPLAICAHLEL